MPSCFICADFPVKQQELKKENEDLSEQKKLLEDDKHIEGVAREELGLVKPGEVPYVR